MNPYEVLGVSESASDKEVRAAYLKLVKKYHPDRYQDNPLKNLADEKLKEINEAYDTVNRERAQGKRTGGGYGSDTYSGGYSAGGRTNSYTNPGAGGYTGAYQSEFNRVRQSLNNQSLHEAAAILDSIPTHNAEWHYLYGIVCFRSGEYSQAYDYLKKATQMEPDNIEYRQAFSTLSSRGSRRYNSAYRRSSESSSCSVCDMCSTLICADCCCECMGGDLIRCI